LLGSAQLFNAGGVRVEAAGEEAGGEEERKNLLLVTLREKGSKNPTKRMPKAAL
jgi:hypothetical protein